MPYMYKLSFATLAMKELSSHLINFYSTMDIISCQGVHDY